MQRVTKSRRPVVIATDASTNLKSGFAERYEILIVPRRFRLGRQVYSTVEGPTQFATDRALPELLPAQLEDFVRAYKQVSNASIVSIHSAATLDNAAHQANVARNLLSPSLDVQVFEAKTIDGGVQCLVETAGSCVKAIEEATKEQVLALLERVQREMITLLFARGTGGLPCDSSPTLAQMLSCLLGSRLVFRLDSSTGMFKQIQADPPGPRLRFEDTQEIIVQWRRRNVQETNRLLAEMIGRIRSDNFELREIYLRNPLFPDDFVGLVAFPNSARISELIKWVKRWG